jgi:hypothetical protein
MTDLIKFAVHKDNEAEGRFHLAFRNLTKAEAAELLLVLDRLQKTRED